MSFILDALRKSESERRRDAVPGVMHMPLAPARAHAPAWVWPVLAMLAAGLAVVSVAWWQNTRTAAPSRPAADSAEPAAAARSRGTVDAARDAAASAETGADRGPIVPLAELAAQGGQTGRPAATSPAPAAAAETARPSAAAPRREPVPESLPRLAEILADGASLPPLQLELHVYSETPASRFVFIDGSRRVEGDSFDGVEIIRITPQGVLLAHAGTQFLLLPD